MAINCQCNKNETYLLDIYLVSVKGTNHNDSIKIHIPRCYSLEEIIFLLGNVQETFKDRMNEINCKLDNYEE